MGGHNSIFVIHYFGFQVLEHEQIVTRETLSQLTELKLSVIDDRLSYLVDSSQIIRVQRAVFIPTSKHRVSRIMSCLKW